MDDAGGQIVHTHSVSAGLDYPGVGPEHAWLKDSGRAEYVGITDTEALQAFHQLTRLEGILPALESSHAVAHGIKLAGMPLYAYARKGQEVERSARDVVIRSLELKDIEGDVLHGKHALNPQVLAALPGAAHLVANLPFNAATPVIAEAGSR